MKYSGSFFDKAFCILICLPWAWSNNSCSKEINPASSRISPPLISISWARSQSADTNSSDQEHRKIKGFIAGEEMSLTPHEILQVHIVCSHSKPVKWVLDDKMLNGFPFLILPFRITRNSSQHLPDMYMSVIGVAIQSKSDSVLICEDIESRCHSQMVLLRYNSSTDCFVLRNVNSSERSSYSLITESLNKANNETCEMRLSLYYVNVSREWSYIWHNTKNKYGSIGHLSTGGMIENKFRLTRTLSNHCVSFRGIKSSSKRRKVCPTCRQMNLLEWEPGYRVVYFYNSARGAERAFKIIVDVSSHDMYYEAKAIKDFRLTKILDYNGIRKKSLEFIKGQTLHFYCKGSGLKFSQGGLVFWAIPGDDEPSRLSPVDSFSKVQNGSFTGSFQLSIPNEILEERNASFINIACFFPVWNTAEWVTRKIRAFIKDPKLSAPKLFDESHGTEIPNESTLLLNERDQLNVSCVGTGVPIPKVTLQSENKNRTLILTKSRTESSEVRNLYLERVDASREGVYRCLATNFLGQKEVTFKLKLVTGYSTFVLCLLITSCVAGGLFLLIGGFLLTKYRSLQMEFNRKTEEVVGRFHGGFKDIKTITCVCNNDYKSCELPRSHWNYGEIIGKGAFGTVHKGFITKDQEVTTVAIKTINAPKDVTDFETSLKELLIMGHIGSHLHIVNLIASCTENISKRSLMLATREFCCNGDLVCFIRKNKANFYKANKASTERYLNTEEAQLCLDIGDIHENKFSTWDLNIWALHIADGMSFLESKKVLHGDLAARNVLLTEHKIAKICDFGLSRQLTDDDNYTKKTCCPLPWKWMALESLLYRQFSSKSDVWSYGVTLYEIFSIGEEPWRFMEWNAEFVDELENGRRLMMPTFASLDMYETVMLECWRNNPDERPSFTEIKNCLTAFVGQQN